MQSLAESNKSLGGSAGKLGDQIKDLSGKLGINIPKDITKALNGLKGFSVGTVAAMGAAATGVATMIKVCKELHEITLQAAADADELITQSMVTGLSTETLQQWEYAQNLIDVSVETMTGSLTKLTRAMYDAQTGNAAAAETFQALGISITDSSGQLRSAEEVFYEVIDALGGIESQTERDAIAMEIMGRSAQDLNPLIIQGSAALRELSEEAKKAGYVLDESQIKKLGEVDDAHQKLISTMEAEKKKIAAEWAPAEIAAMEAFANAVKVAGDAVVESGLLENLATIIEHGANIFETVTSIADKIPAWLNPVESASKKLEFLNKNLEITMRYLKGTMNLFGEFFGKSPQMQNYGGIGSDVYGATWKDDVQAYVTMGGTVITPDIIDQIDKATGKPINNFYANTFVPGDSAYSYGHMDETDIQRLLAGRNAAGTDNWRGGLTWVGESGPELVSLPRGSQIYNSQESRAMAGVHIGTVVIEASKIRELNDLVRIFQGAQIEGRMM